MLERTQKAARDARVAVRNVREVWTENDDMALMRSVRLNGKNQWKAIAINVPGRTSEACRQRWNRIQDKQKMTEESGMVDIDESNEDLNDIIDDDLQVLSVVGV